MEIQQLDTEINKLENVISNFPTGANTLDDLKPIEERISELRESLTVLNAMQLTLKAMNHLETSSNRPKGDISKSFDQLNINTTNHLINSRVLKLCYQSRAIQDIIYKNAGTPEIQEKVKTCLRALFLANDEMTAKNEKKKELMKKQYQMKIEFHHSLYDHQAFLKEKEARKNQHLQETNPKIVELKDKINKSLAKIYTMKRLITNMIASMSKKLQDFPELVDMLGKHKEVINLEYIIELTQKQSSGSS